MLRPFRHPYVQEPSRLFTRDLMASTYVFHDDMQGTKIARIPDTASANVSLSSRCRETFGLIEGWENARMPECGLHLPHERFAVRQEVPEAQAHTYLT
jgi:hypothetical protein